MYWGFGSWGKFRIYGNIGDIVMIINININDYGKIYWFLGLIIGNICIMFWILKWLGFLVFGLG